MSRPTPERLTDADRAALTRPATASDERPYLHAL